MLFQPPAAESPVPPPVPAIRPRGAADDSPPAGGSTSAKDEPPAASAEAGTDGPPARDATPGTPAARRTTRSRAAGGAAGNTSPTDGQEPPDRPATRPAGPASARMETDTRTEADTSAEPDTRTGAGTSAETGTPTATDISAPAGPPARKRAPRKTAPAEETGQTTPRATPRKRATPLKKPTLPGPTPEAAAPPTAPPSEPTPTPAPTASQSPSTPQSPATRRRPTTRQRPPAGSTLGTAPISPEPTPISAPVQRGSGEHGGEHGQHGGGAYRGPELAVLRARLLAHPGFAPELLALAAVGRSGRAPGSGRAACGTGTRMPVRTGWPGWPPGGSCGGPGVGGATAAVAGLFAPVAELAAVLWTQSELVLHLAAAYGRDPAHPDRAVELLVLTQVHPDADSARSALDAARAADGPGDGPWPRAAEAAWRLAAPLAAQAGGWAALRLAARLLPGAAVVAAALGDVAATDRLAVRAMAAYRPGRALG